jgi:hypothetical protein
VLLNGPDDDVEALLAPFDEQLEIECYVDTDGETYARNPQGMWDWWVLGGRYARYAPDGRPICRKRELVAPDPEWWYSILAEGVYREREPWDRENRRYLEGGPEAYDRWYDAFWPTIPADQWVAVVDCHS